MSQIDKIKSILTESLIASGMDDNMAFRAVSLIAEDLEGRAVKALTSRGYAEAEAKMFIQKIKDEKIHLNQKIEGYRKKVEELLREEHQKMMNDIFFGRQNPFYKDQFQGSFAHSWAAANKTPNKGT